MKTKRFILTLFLGIFSLAGLALAISMFSSNINANTEAEKSLEDLNPTTAEQAAETYPKINVSEGDSDGYSFSGITLDISNTQTIFYVGDEFNCDGLKVTANYRKNQDGRWLTKQKEITAYSVDASAFDSSKVGSVEILISYREGDNPQTRPYTVQILASKYDRLPVGSKYAAGLKVTFKDSGTFLKDMYVGETASISGASFNFKLITNTVTEDGFDQAESTIAARSVVIDMAAIDTSKIGTYTIKLTYKGANVTIDGAEYENIVVSFAIVNVNNPVVSIEKYSTGDTTFEATAEVLDFSEWQFKLTRKIASQEAEIVNFNSELFSLSGVSLLLTGECTALVEYQGKYEGLSRPSVQFTVTVIESVKYDIHIYNDLSKVAHDGQKDLAVGSMGDTVTGVDLSNGDGILVADCIKSSAKVVVNGALEFTTKVTIQPQAKNSELRINLAGPGKVVLYVSSTSSGDLVRSFIIRDPNGDDLAEGYTAHYNTAEDRFEFDAPAAGVYTLIVPSGGIYVWGAVVAVEK